MNLHEYDIIIINSSAGKDSLCAMWEIRRMSIEQDYPQERIQVSHQCLGRIEWPGTKELAKVQADLFGWPIHYTARPNGQTLLDYARLRGMWPSPSQRWCTSEFKRDPGAKVVRRLAKTGRVLYIFGFRADESPSRRKKKVLKLNKRLTTKEREVWEYLPIHKWGVFDVWQTIKGNNLPYHPAYDYGMPRLSCVFCIYSPFDALVVAGLHNPTLLSEYVAAEAEMGHQFQFDIALADVQKAIADGYRPNRIADWVM